MRLLLLAGLFAACDPSTYRIQRTVRVPHAAAPLWDGAPMQGPVELSGGVSSALDLWSPQRHDPGASVEVPSQQVRAELRLRMRRDFQLALIHQRALAGSYRPLDVTQAPVRDGAAKSVGLALRYSIHVGDSPGFTIGLGVEAHVWTLPYVEYMSCISRCDGTPLQVQRGNAAVGVLAYSLVPAYRSGRWTVFGGLYLTPHPSVRRKSTEAGPAAYDSEVEAGDMNLVVHAGVELSVRQLSVLAQIQDDLSVSPVSYAPSFGLAIAGRLPSSIPVH